MLLSVFWLLRLLQVHSDVVRFALLGLISLNDRLFYFSKRSLLAFPFYVIDASAVLSELTVDLAYAEFVSFYTSVTRLQVDNYL